jgi:hypothetical protein
MDSSHITTAKHYKATPWPGRLSMPGVPGKDTWRCPQRSGGSGALRTCGAGVRTDDLAGLAACSPAGAPAGGGTAGTRRGRQRPAGQNPGEPGSRPPLRELPGGSGGGRPTGGANGPAHRQAGHRNRPARRRPWRAGLHAWGDAQCVVGPEETEGRLTDATEMLQFAEIAGNGELVHEAHTRRIECLLELGDTRAVGVEIDALRRLDEELRQPTYLMNTLVLDCFAKPQLWYPRGVHRLYVPRGALCCATVMIR